MADTYRPLYGGVPSHDSPSKSSPACDSDISGDDSRSRRLSDFSHTKGSNSMSTPRSPQAQQNLRRVSTSLTQPTSRRESVAPPTLSEDTVNNIALILSEVFPPLFNSAVETLVLTSQNSTAQKELKKKREDYNRSKPNHDKFPSAEESQRRARDYAEKACKSLVEEIKAKDASLKRMSSSALSKVLPKIIPGLLEAMETAGNSNRAEKRCEDLEKRSLKLERQLNEQRELLTELKASNYKLQQQCSESQRKTKDDGDHQRKQRETDAELYNLKNRFMKVQDDIRHVQLRKSKDEKSMDDFKREVNSLAKSQSDMSLLKAAIPVDMQKKLENLDRLSAQMRQFETLGNELENRAEKHESKLGTINNYIASILEDQKKFCDFCENFPGAAQQGPDLSEAVGAMRAQINSLDRKMAVFASPDTRITTSDQNLTQFKTRLAELEHRLISAENRMMSPTSKVNEAGSTSGALDPQTNELRDKIEDVQASLDAMGDTWSEAVDKLRDSLVPRVDSAERAVSLVSRIYDDKFNTATNQSHANSLAIANLETRYNNISTFDLFKAMSDQFTQEQFPQFEPLRVSIQGMARRIIEIESAIKSQRILPPAAEEKIHAVEKESHRLSELVGKIESQLSLLEADVRLQIDSLAGELRKIQPEVSQMDKICQTRLESCTEIFGDTLAKIRREMRDEFGSDSKKRKLANGNGLSVSHSTPAPNNLWSPED